jgi:hypothetical protein
MRSQPFSHHAHLVAQALAAAGGHDDEVVAPLDRGADDVHLGLPELAVPPVPLQQRQQARVGDGRGALHLAVCCLLYACGSERSERARAPLLFNGGRRQPERALFPQKQREVCTAGAGPLSGLGSVLNTTTEELGAASGTMARQKFGMLGVLSSFLGLLLLVYVIV